jgi:hypothetical protein
VFVGVVTIVVSVCVALVGLQGVRSGRSIGRWSVALAVAGAGIAAGALLVQDRPGVSSWLIAVPLGAAMCVVHARALFSPGGPLRT